MKTAVLRQVDNSKANEYSAEETSGSRSKIRNRFRKCRLSVGIPDEVQRRSSGSSKKRKLSSGSDGESPGFSHREVGLKAKKMRPSLLRKSSHSYLLPDGRRSSEAGSRLPPFRRSISFIGVLTCSSGKSVSHPYSKSPPHSTGTKCTPTTRRLSTYWFETIDKDTMRGMDKIELDRQEAIYELYRGEKELVDDLFLVNNTYRKSMKKLDLLCDDDLDRLFGEIGALLPIHQGLVDSLKSGRSPDGTTAGVGEVLVQWVRKLAAYVPYCGNQVYAKELLDERKQQPAVDDFLQRCQQSPFSRKLDLWNFLDVPRSKLVKYPLLFRRIQKLTPIRHDDHFYLEKAIQDVNAIIETVDLEAGRARCQFIKDKLQCSDYVDKRRLIENSTSLVCDGVLRCGRRSKLHVFLFDQILLLTRKITRGRHVQYRVCRQPIAASDLATDDADSDVSRTSFKSPFSSSRGDRRSFKVMFQNSRTGHSYALMADNEHDKRLWLSAIKTTMAS